MGKEVTIETKTIIRMSNDDEYVGKYTWIKDAMVNLHNEGTISDYRMAYCHMGPVFVMEVNGSLIPINLLKLLWDFLE